MNADDELRLSYLRRAWEPIEEWDRTADPSCPCKGLVAPYLAGWREFLSDPDAMGVDEQERAALAARSIITKYARPDSIGDLFREHVQRMADVVACEAGDPRCAPLPKTDSPLGGTGTMKTTWRYVVEQPPANPLPPGYEKWTQAQQVASGITDTTTWDASIRAQYATGQPVYIYRQTEQNPPTTVPLYNTLSQDRTLDPYLGAAPPAGAAGAAPDASGARDNPIGALGQLFGSAVSSVATPAATDAGKAAGDAAGRAAAAQIAAAVPAAAAALKQELPGLASAARDAVAPLVTPIAQQAGAEAGKAAVNAAKQQAGYAGSLTPVVVVGGIGAVGLLAWLLLRKGK